MSDYFCLPLHRENVFIENDVKNVRCMFVPIYSCITFKYCLFYNETRLTPPSPRIVLLSSYAFNISQTKLFTIIFKVFFNDYAFLELHVSLFLFNYDLQLLLPSWRSLSVLSTWEHRHC